MTAAAVVLAAGTAYPAKTGAVTKRCGKQARIPKSSGGFWRCAFGDGFRGGALNRANWEVMTTAQTGFAQGGTCYVDDRKHVRVHHGRLTLTVTKQPAAQLCGPVRTQYEGGLVRTYGRFAQTYGRFQARLKMPSGTGLQSAFWMWPESLVYGQQSGEIDVAEGWGVYPEMVSPHIHVRNSLGLGPDQLRRGAYCGVTDPSGTFHRYTLVWLPNELRFAYDGKVCLDVTTWDPAFPLAFPKPFDQPFFMILQVALGSGAGAPTESSVFPAKLVVDYVRAWR